VVLDYESSAPNRATTTTFVQRNAGAAERTAPAGTSRARTRGRAKGAGL
jgi:hypothetical protein